MTYSIVATDSATREVGGAGTSCVNSLSVHVIYGSVPGHGAVHAQAALGGGGRDRAVMLLGSDLDPAAIVMQITDDQFDGGAQSRQYGVVDLMGRAAGFSGANTGAVADDRQGRSGAFTYSVQGNILTSGAVLDQATTSFESAGCDLADRLMLALEAGAQNGEGDSRCTGGGIPSDSAFLEVDRDGEPAGSFLFLDVTDTAPQNPLVLLRAQYDAWRATHPCPVAPDGAGDTDAGVDPGDMMAGGGCCSTSAGSDGAALAVIVLVAVLVRRR